MTFLAGGSALDCPSGNNLAAWGSSACLASRRSTVRVCDRHYKLRQRLSSKKRSAEQDFACGRQTSLAERKAKPLKEDKKEIDGAKYKIASP